ncbi:MAG: C-GCAxxG-C-C family protein [Acetobacter sp.]|nr:C-GCAxxG-C-C family protein [Bacteroides sp.]MCM1341257.1 C-GCAxxG-C-C family protein [Acetobacter sp.]MCM1433966.1 C-GCAxxG-C-C family protein [Clostridiales bacterium]
MTKGEQAYKLFKEGLTCSQAVAVSFADEMKLDKDLVARLTIGFGGGMGRMREVCGTVSGMTFVISALYDEDKAAIYKKVQDVANRFKEKNGSIVCRELLGLTITGADNPTPAPRTEEYYKKRPCAEIAKTAADILEEYIKLNPPKNN